MDEDKIPTFWSRSDVAEILKGELLPDTDANIDIVISDRETIDRLRNACHNVILEGVARLAEEDRLERHPVSLALEDALLSRGDVEVVPIEFINDLIEGGPQHWSLALGIFAAEEPGGGFTVAYNNTGDCFTETFATLAATLAYINGDEIEECYRIDRENRVEEGRLDPLPVERIGFDDEVSQDGDHLTFLSTANFDTERVFGMRADYIRIDYDVSREEVGDHLLVAQFLDGRGIKPSTYNLDFEQRLALHARLDDFCKEKYGMGLAAYAEEVGEGGPATFSRGAVQHVEAPQDDMKQDEPTFKECGTFTDHGFGFHAQKGTMTDYVIVWPFENGSWAVLTGSYDLEDDDLDCHVPEDYLNGLLARYGYSALSDLKSVNGDTSCNVLTGIIARDQEENRFEVPHIFPDASSAARFCTSLGVPGDLLRPAMENARAEYEMCELPLAPEKALSGLDLDAEARDARGAGGGHYDGINPVDRGWEAR